MPIIPLPQDYAALQPALFSKAKKLIVDKAALERLVEVSHPLHEDGKLVAAALFLIAAELEKDGEPSLNLIADTQKYWIPLANNFGMWKTRYYLEDALFEIIDKPNYDLISSLIEKRQHVQEKLFHDISSIVSHYLQSKDLRGFEILSRQKNVFGIYEKARRKKRNINHVTDFFAFRILVDREEECYLVLDVLHSLWPHYPDRLKDYIKIPKINFYKSLHTTLFSLDFNVVEFQIRTRGMDYIAKYGAASHALYKNAIWT